MIDKLIIHNVIFVFNRHHKYNLLYSIRIHETCKKYISVSYQFFKKFISIDVMVKKRQQQDLNLRGKTQQISSLPP